MTLRRLASLALILLFTLPALGQELRLGVPVPGSLEPDSRFTYTFESQPDFWVYGQVNQISVDVVVRLLDPDGDLVQAFDSPARGPEPFQISPDAAGIYTIEVTPFEGAEGEYEVLLIANERKATDPRRLADQLFRPFSGTDRPGAVISVLKDGRVAFQKGYGMANLTHAVPMTPATGMSVASVSKHFTGMAIVLLAQDDSLSLDDDVRMHIPELRDFGTTVTLRHLLNHQSGYREILNFLPMGGWAATDAMSREEPIRVIQRQPVLQNEPGAEYNYNNTAFTLLATVVERVSGQDFDDFMRERIFGPLGMDDTTIKMHQGQVIPNSSQGYASTEDGGFRAVTDFASLYGASSVVATASDMTKWMRNFTEGTVGGQEGIDLLTTRGILSSGDTTGYALGIGVGEWRGQRIWSHNGGEVSHSTRFVVFPDIESGLFISSSHPAFSLGMWSDLAEAFFEEHLEPEPADEEDASADTVASTEPTAEQLEAIAGLWQFVGAPLKIEYTVQDGELFAQATGQPQFKVEPTSDSTFAFVGVEASVTFHYEADGSVNRATHHQGPDSPMTRIEGDPITAEDLADFEGRYYSDELETVYTIRVEEGDLRAHHRRVESFGLEHVDGDEFSAGIWFMGTVTFERDPDGTVSGFTAGNGRTRGVWFRRME